MKGAKYPYRISVDLPKDLYRELHMATLDHGSKKEITTEALRDWLKKHKK